MKSKYLKLTLTLAATTLFSSTLIAAQNDTPAATLTVIGEVFVSPQGKTLYTFAKDQAGVSNCNGACATKWPPLIASGNIKPLKNLSVITRTDGSKQWAYKGAALYTWFKDKKIGEVSGHGVKNVWFAARSDDAPISVYSIAGKKVLTDSKKMSLYIFSKDEAGQSNCNQGCAQKWPPLFADKHQRASAPYSIIERSDGRLQWALNNQALYTWVKDAKPGDVTGDGVKGVWSLAKHP